MTLQLRLGVVLGVVAVVGGVACGGSSDGGPPPSGLKTVAVANNEFQPITVNITAGDTILWAWTAGSMRHNVLSTGAPSFASQGTAAFPGTLNTDYFNEPASHQVVFGAAGTYAYYCSQHGTTGPGGNTGMAGTVVVAP
jgi:plastocyanin